MFALSLILLRVAPEAPISGRLTDALGALGRSSGEVIRAAPALGEPYLYIQPHGAGTSGCLRAVGAALHASVKKTADGWSLFRGENDKRLLEQIHRDIADSWITNLLAKEDRQYALADRYGSSAKQLLGVLREDRQIIELKGSDPGKVHYRTHQPADFTPSVRLLHALLRRIGVQKLAEVEDGSPRTYCTSPTPIELPLSDCSAEIERFVKDQAILAPYLRDQAVQAEIANGGLSSFIGTGDTDDPATWRVLLTEWREFGNIRFQLHIYDRQGRSVVEGYSETRGVLDGYDASTTYRREFHDPAAPWCEVTPNSFQFMKKIVWDGPAPEIDHHHPVSILNRHIPDTWPEALATPEKMEPDAFLLPNIAAALAARYPAKPFVGVLADNLWPAAVDSVLPPLPPLPNGQPNLAEPARGHRAFLNVFLKAISGDAQYEIAEGVEGAFLRPKDILESDRCRMDRHGMGEGVRQIIEDRRISVANWSRLCALTDDGHYNPLRDWYFHALRRAGLPSDPSITSCRGELLRLLGAETEGDLPPNSGTYAIGGHSAQGIAAVQGLVLSPWPTFSRPSEVPAIFERASELFPDGQIQATVQLGVRREAFLKVITNGQVAWNPFGQTPESLAVTVFLPPRNTDRKEFDRTVASLANQQGASFRFGSNAIYDIEVVLPHGLRAQHELRDLAEESEVRLADVPSSFWDSVYRARLRAAIAHGGNQGPAKSVPPP